MTGVVVMGANARFACGSQDAPFTGRVEIIIREDRSFAEAAPAVSPNAGSRGVLVMNGGELALYGDPARTAPFA